MTEPESNEAIRRAVPLLRRIPDRPRTAHGYLDLLDGAEAGGPGIIQRLWSSPVGPAGYDTLMRLARKWVPLARIPSRTFDLADGATVLDVCCGPGTVTAALADAAGPDGLVLGVDVSRPMLRRAVATVRSGNAGFLRADALDLPLRDGTCDAVTCMAGLQLIPRPHAVIDEMLRVLRPGAG